MPRIGAALLVAMRARAPEPEPGAGLHRILVVGAEWAKARRNHKKEQLAADMAAVFGDDENRPRPCDMTCAVV